MDKLNAITFRREIIDWRDKWVTLIPGHLERELPILFADLDKSLDQMGVMDIFSSEVYIQKKLQPLFSAWIENEVRYLVSESQKELDQISSYIIEHEMFGDQLSSADTESYSEVAKTTATAGVALAAIPGVIALSTTSAGGVLGMIGLTTISWPIALVGISVVGGLLAFSGNKAINIKAKATDKLKIQIREMLNDLVLVGEDSSSITLRLQESIENVSAAYLKEIGNGY